MASPDRQKNRRQVLVGELEDIVRKGGGIRIDAGNYLPAHLVRIAEATADKKVKLHIYNAEEKLSSQLIDIAIAGEGRFFFEF